MTIELHNTESPLSRAERNKMNENWQRIIGAFDDLKQRTDILAGNQDVKELVANMENALTEAINATEGANTATSETAQATLEALEAAVDALEATEQANNATLNAQQVANENKTKWLQAVETVALRDSTYPNPQHGDTVRVTSEAKTYRYVSPSGWVVTDIYNATVVDQLTEQLAEKTTHVKAEDIKTTKYSTRRALFTLIDDDGRKEVMTKLKPLLDAKGWKAGTAIITSYVGSGNYMPWNDIDNLFNEGWEIMSHTKTHAYLHTLTDAQQIDELQESLDVLNAKGYNCQGIVYPYSSQNEFSRDYVSKHYKYGFGGWGFNNTPINSTYITRYTLGEDESLTLANFKSYVDSAIANKTWMVLCTHIGTLSANALQILSDLLDYIATKDIGVVTPAEGYEIFGNTIESRNHKTDDFFCVSKTGEVYGTGIYRNFQTRYNTGVTATTPIESFIKDKMEITWVSSSAAGFPSNTGLLITFRDNTSNDEFSYQEWITYDMAKRYLRKWEVTSKVWGIWKQYGGSIVNYDSINARNASDAPSTYPQGLTVTTISGSSYGFPASAGVLYTYRFNTADVGMQYQEFHATATNTIYFRNTGWGGSWNSTWDIRAIKKTITYSMTAKTVPANDCLDLIVPLSGLKEHHTIYINPGGDFEGKVGINAYYYSDNNLVIRFINPTTSNKSLAARDIKITIS